MTTFPIERGVSIPPREGKRALYDWDGLSVGDSFLVPVTNSEWKRKEARIWASFSQWRKKPGNAAILITTRRVENGIRIWRVE